ncbi:hypothetical protein [Lysobacter terrae]
MSTRANGPLAGLAWLKRGLNVGRYNPRAIFGGAAVLMMAAMVPTVLQVLAHSALQPGPGAAAVIAALATVLSVLLLGPLMGGYLRVIDASERGASAHAADVLAPFRDAHDLRRMIAFSFVMLLVQLGAFSLLMAIFGSVLEALQAWSANLAELVQSAKPGQQPPQLPAPPEGLGGLFSLAGLFALFVAAVFAIGLGQLALRGRSVGAALLEGLSGAARNLLPLLVLALVAFAAVMAASVAAVLVVSILTLLHPVLGALGLLLFYLVAMLALYAVMFGVMYHFWRDVAGDTPPAAAIAGFEA